MNDVDISRVMSKDLVFLDVETFKDKQDAFKFMVDKFIKAGVVLDKEDYIKALEDRENLASTYMRDLIAIPHGRSDKLGKTSICFCRCKKPFLYSSCSDEGEVKYVFMLAVANKEGNDHYIKVLASLARILMHDEFISAIEKAKDYDDIIKGIDGIKKREEDKK